VRASSHRTGETADTPGPKWYGGGRLASELQTRCLQDHPACNRQLRALSSVMMELGKATALPLHLEANQARRRENASECRGGRRRRSSQMLSCNGLDKVKVRQGENHDVTTRMANGLPTVTSKQESTDLTGNCRYDEGRVTRFPWCVPGTQRHLVWSALPE